MPVCLRRAGRVVWSEAEERPSGQVRDPEYKATPRRLHTPK